MYSGSSKSLRTKIILFFFCFKISNDSLVNFGAITTSQKRLFISSATSIPISELLIRTPPNADTGSAAKASI